MENKTITYADPQLPDEILLEIFKHTTLKARVNASISCQRFYGFFKQYPELLELPHWDQKPFKEQIFKIHYDDMNNMLFLKFLPESSKLVIFTSKYLMLYDWKKNEFILREKHSGVGNTLGSVSEKMIVYDTFDCFYHIYSISDRKTILKIKNVSVTGDPTVSDNRFFIIKSGQFMYYDLNTENPKPIHLALGDLKPKQLIALSDDELILELPTEKYTGNAYYYFNIVDPKQNCMIVENVNNFYIVRGKSIYYISNKNILYQWNVQTGSKIVKDLSGFLPCHFNLLSHNCLLITKNTQKIGGGMMSLSYYTESSVDIYSLTEDKVLGNYTYSHTNFPSFVVSPNGYICHRTGSGCDTNGKYFIVKFITYNHKDRLKPKPEMVKAEDTTSNMSYKLY